VRALLVLLRLRLLEVVRSRSTTFFFLGMPLCLLLVLAGVFARGHPFEEERVVVVAGSFSPARQSSLLADLRALEAVRVEVVGERAVGDRKLRARIASALIVADDRGDPRVITSARRGLLARGLAAAIGAPPPTVEPMSPWGYVHYLFPGVLVFSALVAGLFGMGHHLLVLRSSGFLRKLATTPLPRSTFVLALVGGRSLLVLVQAAVLLLAGHLFLGLALSPASLPPTFALLLLGTVTFHGAGFALACVVQDEAAMVDAISAFTTPLVVMSEVFFPVDVLPAPLSQVAAALPTTQLVRALRSVVVFEEPASAVAGSALVLGLWCAGTFLAGVLAFRWR
jgi:ABC-2 type transport system permease protein